METFHKFGIHYVLYYINILFVQKALCPRVPVTNLFICIQSEEVRSDHRWVKQDACRNA